MTFTLYIFSHSYIWYAIPAHYFFTSAMLQFSMIYFSNIYNVRGYIEEHFNNKFENLTKSKCFWKRFVMVSSWNRNEFYAYFNCKARTTISEDVQTQFPVQLAFAKLISRIKGNFWGTLYPWNWHCIKNFPLL